MELILVRHGRPERVERVESVAADPPLSDLGRAQAEEVGRFLAARGVDVVVSSPLRRAHQTAEPLAAMVGLGVEVVDGLAEVDASRPTYVPTEEMAREDRARWLDIARNPEQVLGADPGAFLVRVRSAADELIVANPGATVVAFAHVGVINAVLSGLLHTPRAMPFAFAYCSISRVHAARDGWRSVTSINETGHLGSPEAH